MKIRPVVRGDVEEILKLFESVAAEGLWIGTEPDFDRKQYIEFISSASRRTENSVAFVGLSDKGKIVAEITGYRDPETQRWSLGMLVLKKYRRLGLGAALLTTFIEWAKKAQIAELHLQVFPHNEAALALYRRFGFVQEAYHKNQLLRRNGERWDTVEMVLSLQ